MGSGDGLSSALPMLFGLQPVMMTVLPRIWSAKALATSVPVVVPLKLGWEIISADTSFH